MPFEATTILAGGIIGMSATLLMDLWNLFLKRAFQIPSLNYCLLGRWLGHMPLGIFRHLSIAAAAPRPLECQLGWVAHYSIGISLAVTFVLLAPASWLERPTVLPALLYGLGTVVFPFFVLQPSLGLGIASAHTPKPLQARLKSLGTHAVFGFALYICALGWQWVGCAA